MPRNCFRPVQLTLFLAGYERFDSGRGDLFGPLQIPKTIHRSDERQTAFDRSLKNLQLLHKTFSSQVNIEVTRAQRSSTIKCFGIICLYNFWTKKHRDIKVKHFVFLSSRRCEISMRGHSQVNLKFDPRSRSGHSPMGLWSMAMLHTKRRALTRRTVWYHLQVFSTIMSWFIEEKTIYDVTWPQMTFPGAPVNKRHQDHHRWDVLPWYWKNWVVLTRLHESGEISIFSHRLAM